MKQYLDLAQRIINEGIYVENTRTNTRCLTVLNHTLHYSLDDDRLPLVTTRKSYWKAAVAELLGYIRGYSNAHDFAKLGTPTWIANANNPTWTSNPNYRGDGDMGKVYGVIGNDFGGINQFRSVYEDLKSGNDNRGEIITFWKPDDFDKGCLRPCMFQHQFSLLDGVLHLTSYQRSCDVPLGLNFNMVQCAVFLAIMAQVTGHKAGTVTHHIVNAHIYENQVDLMAQVQLHRVPYEQPQFKINPRIKTWDDVMTMTPDDITVTGYQSHEPIKYPFTV